MEENDIDFDVVALRRYQLERLRYYYAVVECDSIDTAYTIFKAADGAEFEATSNFFDLRFIPDDVSFDEDEPARDIASPESNVAYRPVKFETRALQSSNIKLTWDEDDPDRAHITRKNLSYEELKALDFKDYVASESSDDDDVRGNNKGNQNNHKDEEIAKYRALLGLDEPLRTKKDKNNRTKLVSGDSDGDSAQGDMEITFTPGLSETAERLIAEREQRKQVENETTIEKYQRKQREKKLKHRQSQVEGDEGKKGATAQQIEDLGFNDPFFTMDMDMEEVEAEERMGSFTKYDQGITDKNEGMENRVGDPELGNKSSRKKKRQSKRKQLEEEKRGEDEEDGIAEFSVDATDARFISVLAESEYAIDPTNPHFRDTPGMKALLKAKRRTAVTKSQERTHTQPGQYDGRINEANPGTWRSDNRESCDDRGLSTLVDAVKRKSASAATGEKVGRRSKRPKRT